MSAIYLVVDTTHAGWPAVRAAAESQNNRVSITANVADTAAIAKVGKWNDVGLTPGELECITLSLKTTEAHADWRRDVYRTPAWTEDVPE